MKRTPLHLATVLAVLVTASAAFAGYEQDIVRQLQSMGFTQVEVTRTLLGRVRITAAGADGTREIILNPNTGEILRDLWLRQDGRTSDRALLDGRSRDDNGSSGRSGGGSGGSDDDDDDDESGSSGSSGNSGSGSGGNSGSNSGSSGNSGSGSGGKSGGGSDDNSGKGGGDDGDDD